MKRLRALGLLALGIVTVAVAATSATSESRDAAVQADIRALFEATYGGDSDKVLRLTHPVVIESLGGRVAAKKTLSEAMKRLRLISLKINTVDFPEPARFVDGAVRSYAIVPTRVVASAGEQRVDSRSFQVGVRDAKGGKWAYIEGPKFQAFRAKHFADFPGDFEFPETSRLQ